MPKLPKQLATQPLKITIPTQLLEEVELLVQSGYFGASVTDAMNWLISEGVKAAHMHAAALFEGRDLFAKLHRELPKVRRSRPKPK